MESWQAIAEQYTDEQLTLILGFQNQLEQMMRDRLTSAPVHPPPNRLLPRTTRTEPSRSAAVCLRLAMVAGTAPGRNRRLPTGDVLAGKRHALPDRDPGHHRTCLPRPPRPGETGWAARTTIVSYLDDHVSRLLTTGSYQEETGQQLAAACGELSQLAGWVAYDSDEHGLGAPRGPPRRGPSHRGRT